MGCSESKGTVSKLPPPTDAPNDDSDGRRPSVIVARQSSSTSLLNSTNLPPKSAFNAFKTANNSVNAFKTANNNDFFGGSNYLDDLGSTDSSGRGSKPQTPPEDEELRTHSGGLPGSTENAPITSISGRIPSALEHIPTSDLGESLDVRRALRLFRSESMLMATSGAGSGHSRSAPGSRFDEDLPPPDSAAFDHHGWSSHSALSGGSEDSGISDPGEDYSFVITENSPPELVRRVEQEFMPVEHLNLIITGKACPRMLSGYQKTRQEEAAILESLREEGFISTSKTKSAGGMAFEVMEATPQTLSASGTFKPQDFLPVSAQKKMEERRTKFGPGERSADEVERRSRNAERRRQAELDARQEKMAELTKGADTEWKKLEELALKQDTKTDAALQKREAHLKELRDKLKAQNLRAQHVKLKKLINGPPVPVPMSRASPGYGAPGTMTTTDIFFD